MPTSYRTRISFFRPCNIVSTKWDIPVIARQELLSYDNISLVAFSDISLKPSRAATSKGVHFFIDDYRFERVYRLQDRYIECLKAFPFVLSPDFSLYNEMPRVLQLDSVFRNRWCGYYWQSHGITVIPTISWSYPASFEFCFAGVEPHSTVAISTVGARNPRTKRAFMLGYNEMLTRLEPDHIICLGKPFDEMSGNIHVVDYMASRRGNR